MSRIASTKTNPSKKQIAMHELLTRICPKDGEGRKSINKLAEHLELSSWAVYHWIKVERIPAKRINQLAKVAKSRATKDEILKFVIG